MSILNTSVSGMLADSNWLSSISQNVANSNTTGYKNVETDFSSLVDQISGIDPAYGGVATSQASLNSLQGNIVSTSTSTDLAIQGSGFFVVSNSSGELFLTRNGSFTPDASGNLVNSAGYYLMGEDVQNGASPLAANSLTGLVKVNVNDAGQTATATTAASLTANLPSTATPVAAANLPSANTASSTYTEATSLVVYDNLGGRAHHQSLFHQHRGEHLGSRRLRCRGRVGQRRLSLFVRSACHPDPEFRSDNRRALLRLSAFDCGPERADDVA